MVLLDEFVVHCVSCSFLDIVSDVPPVKQAIYSWSFPIMIPSTGYGEFYESK
jgi:hypothetical protein